MASRRARSCSTSSCASDATHLCEAREHRSWQIHQDFLQQCAEDEESGALDRGFHQWVMVVIIGLVDCRFQALNGSIGQLGYWNAKSKRWWVTVNVPLRREFWVKPVNLRLAEDGEFLDLGLPAQVLPAVPLTTSPGSASARGFPEEGPTQQPLLGCASGQAQGGEGAAKEPEYCERPAKKLRCVEPENP